MGSPIGGCLCAIAGVRVSRGPDVLWCEWVISSSEEKLEQSERRASSIYFCTERNVGGREVHVSLQVGAAVSVADPRGDVVMKVK